MIQKIAAQNFEGYEDFEIEFAAGVNTIIGESDKGKSAVFNVFEWIRTNRPLGDGFRSEWGGDTIAEIWTTDNHYIKRVRTDSKNEYWIDDAKKPLKGFGQNPPDVVNEILMIDDVNVLTQDSPPFLLKETSPGEVARILNKAASLDDIDLSISNLSKGLKVANGQITSGESQLENQKQQLSELPDLKKIETKIEILEQHEQCRDILQTKRNKLYSLAKTISQLTLELAETDHLDQVQKRLPELKKLLKKRADLEMEKVVLTNHQKSFERLNAAFETVSTAVEKTNKIINTMQKEHAELVKSLPPNCPLCGSKIKGKLK